MSTVAKSDSDEQVEQTININQIDVTADKDGGVLKEIIKEGIGDEIPLPGDRVAVHYVGTLEDGTKFDSSRDRGEKFEFSLGKGEVIKAWDCGVASMKKGEICKLICKSKYAYGSTGSPPKIPPDATLIFEIELFDWKGEDLSSKKDGGIIRKIIENGDGLETPNEGAIVEVKLLGKHNEDVFDDRELQFPLGEGSDFNIPEGLEKALEKFKKHEKSTIILTPKYGFASAGNEALGIPSNASLEYEVYLKSFEKAKECWEMDQEEKLEQAKLCKTKGTTFFNQDKFRLAVKQYKKITDFLQYDNGLDDEKKAESRSVLLAGHLNLSLCYFKLKDYMHAKEYAAKAIEMDSSNVKAYFRRAKALMYLEEAELAKADLEKCLQLDKTNKAAMQELKVCINKIKEQKQKEKNLYKGMFDKFAKRDAQKAAANGANGDVTVGEWQTAKDSENRSQKRKEFGDSMDDEDSEDHLDDVIQMC